jgi:hypothetical protein
MHYKNSGGAKSENDAMAIFIRALVEKQTELLHEGDMPIIHSTEHNTTIYAHKADA